MVTCKKCGYERSEKDTNYPASECPGCGVVYSKIKDKPVQLNNPQQKKKFVDEHPNLFICFLLLIMFISLVAVNTGGSSKTSSKVDTTDVENSEPVVPKWRVSESKNKMTGKFSAYAYSPDTYKLLSSPYGIVTSNIYVGCDGEHEWIYFYFSQEPNITNAEPWNNNRSHIDAIMKWDDEVKAVRLYQTWGEDKLHFFEEYDPISRISFSNTAMLQIQWYGQGKPIFTYSLEGAAEALTEMRTKCAFNRYDESHK